MAVLPRAQASSTPLGMADFASIHAEFDSCSGTPNALSALDRVLVRQNPWSAFDPEGLWGCGESNGTVLDWIWNKGARVVDMGAAGIRGATVGYVEVVGTGQVPMHYYAQRRAEAWGQRIGRAIGGTQAVVETIGGTGAAALGSGATLTTAGVASPVSVPLAVGGTALAMHGAHSLRNVMNLEPVREPGGGGSAEPSAKNTLEENQKKVPNPDGSNGKADHQAAVEKMKKDFRERYPASEGYEVRSNQSIKGETGLDRRPDAAAVKDGKVAEVGEVPRLNKDGTMVPRERAKQQQYDDAGLKSTFKGIPK